MEEGKAGSTVKNFISVCCTTSDILHPDRRPLSTHSLIAKIKKAALRERPPRSARQPRIYFSIFTLLCHVGTMPTKTILDKGRRLMILMAIDLFARPSDLQAIDRSSVDLHDTFIGFDIVAPKTAPCKAFRLRAEVYRAPDEMSTICTFRALLDYLAVTMPLSDITEPCTKDGITFKPLFAYKAAKQRRLPDGSSADYWRAYKSESISNVIQKEMKLCLPDLPGHDWQTTAIRGMAASKLANLGVPMDRILRRGRWKSQSVFEKSYWTKWVYQTQDQKTHDALIASTSMDALLRTKWHKWH
jgi:hypothetical protein